MDIVNNKEKSIQILLSDHDSYFWPLTNLDKTEVHLGIYDEVQLFFKYDEEKDYYYIQKVTFNKGDTKLYMYIPFLSDTKGYSLIKNLINVVQQNFKDEEYIQNLKKNHDALVYKTTEFILDNFPEKYPS